MAQQSIPSMRFSASWSTQFRFTQAIGRALSELTRIRATVVIGAALRELEANEVDLIYSKSINNEHLSTGKGVYARGERADWLRTIAWLPQEDRFLYAVAPWTGLQSFEDIAARKPALKLAGRAPEPVLKEYGFTYGDIQSWGGTIGSMQHTAREAKGHFDRGELDAFFGDGSAFDFSAWRWVAEHGYRFLDIRPDVMDRLEREYGLRRTITPAGFLPGITQNLIALDDSHIVVTCHERLDDELAYLLARAIDERKRDIEVCSIQVDYGPVGTLPLVQPTYWSSLTGPIERQWDPKILGAPLHPGAERYYRERGLL